MSSIRGRFLVGGIALILLGSAGPADAGGLFLSGVGSRARGMGGAFTALADDWSAVYYNPAGAAFLQQSELAFGAAALTPRISYTPDLTLDGWRANNKPDGEYYNIDQTYVVPQLGGYGRLSSGRMSLGIGFYAQQNNNMVWDLFFPYYRSKEQFPADDVTSDIKIWTAQPTLGWQVIPDQFSLGAGLILNRTRIRQQRVLWVPDPGQEAGLPPYSVGVAFVDQTIEGTGWGVGFNLGFLTKLDKWSFGATFQNKIVYDISGTDTTRFWSQIVDGRGEQTDPLIEQDLLSGKVHTSIQDHDFEMATPAVLTVGTAFFPSPNLRFTFDLGYTWYSEVEGIIATTNPTTTFKFGDPQGVNATTTVGNSEYYDWKDQWRVAVGSEWDPKPTLHLRFGASYEPAVIETTSLTPVYWDVGGKISPSLGIAVDFGGHYTLSYAFGAVFYESRSADTPSGINLPGTYGGLRYDNYLAFIVRI